MKIIEALKQIKDLKRKVDDLKSKIGIYSAYLSHETPAYEDQKEQIRQWVQSCHDIIKEMARLNRAIQKTNLLTQVTVTLGGKEVTKFISEWIYRRRELAALEASVYGKLTDRGLKEGMMNQSTGENIPVNIVRCYDPAERDKKKEEYTSEPSFIDGKLEVVNAVTDLMED